MKFLSVLSLLVFFGFSAFAEEAESSKHVILFEMSSSSVVTMVDGRYTKHASSGFDQNIKIWFGLVTQPTAEGQTKRYEEIANFSVSPKELIDGVEYELGPRTLSRLMSARITGDNVYLEMSFGAPSANHDPTYLLQWLGVPEEILLKTARGGKEKFVDIPAGVWPGVKIDARTYFQFIK